MTRGDGRGHTSSRKSAKSSGARDATSDLRDDPLGREEIRSDVTEGRRAGPSRSACPAVQQSLPPEVHAILTNEVGTVALGVALTAIIISRKH
jgi:hypothetical protein